MYKNPSKLVENDSLATLFVDEERRNMSSRLATSAKCDPRKRKYIILEKYHANRGDRREEKEYCLEKHKNVTELEVACAST